MITLLRKIRKQLLSENRLTRYLIYSIGEIALVMIGILLALQVNNWNAYKEQQSQIKDYLSSTVENLQDDLVTLNRFEEQCLFRYYSLNYLLEHGGGHPVDLRKLGQKPPKWKPNRIWNKEIPDHYDEELGTLGIVWLPRAGTIAPNQSAFEEMKGIGIYSSIENDSLKATLSNFYRMWMADIGETNMDQQRTWIGQWTNSLIDKGIYPYQMDDSEDALMYVNDPKRLALLERITTSAGYHTRYCQELEEEALALIEMIELELK